MKPRDTNILQTISVFSSKNRPVTSIQEKKLQPRLLHAMLGGFFRGSISDFEFPAFLSRLQFRRPFFADVRWAMAGLICYNGRDEYKAKKVMAHLGDDRIDWRRYARVAYAATGG